MDNTRRLNIILTVNYINIDLYNIIFICNHTNTRYRGAYCVAHMAQRPKEQIKMVLLVNFMKYELLNAKKVIWGDMSIETRQDL